jgi:hypothetical protein
MRSQEDRTEEPYVCPVVGFKLAGYTSICSTKGMVPPCCSCMGFLTHLISGDTRFLRWSKQDFAPLLLTSAVLAIPTDRKIRRPMRYRAFSKTSWASWTTCT